MNKPILFNTVNVLAILDNRKRATRRVVKIKHSTVYKVSCANGKWSETYGDEIPERLILWYAKEKAQPMYSVGDILWVRETWNCIRLGNGKRIPYETTYWYKADEKDVNYDNKWRPSIYMPKEAARIFLRVTDVRVERLQDINQINHDDILKEGWPFPVITKTPLNDFIGLWNGINAKRGYPWDANPWVWVYEFEICEKPEGWCES